MQPRKRPFFVRVTKAAPGAASFPRASTSEGIFPAPMYPSLALRASPSSSFRCDSSRYAAGPVPTGSVMDSPPRISDELRPEQSGKRLLESLRQGNFAGDDLRLTGEEGGDDVGVELGPGVAP